MEALEAACHRLLKNPHDEGSRASLLKALATYNTVPMACFPVALLASHDQADALCLRILETDASPGNSIDREAKKVCDTLTSIGDALRMSRARPASPEEGSRP